MLKYYDNDYLRDETMIYGVKGNWAETAEKVLVKPVYHFDGKWIKIVDKKGAYGENFTWVNPSLFQHISSRGLTTAFLERQDVWGAFARKLLSLGIISADIGYFGSYRLGFEHYKDVDFVLYGDEAQRILKANIDGFKQALSLYNLTDQHITYQAETHGRYYMVDTQQLKNALRNKWSSCMVQTGICSTIRFVDLERESGPLLADIFSLDAETTTVTGIVSKAEQASYFPRQFLLTTATEQLNVVIPLWIYHQCVKNGDFIKLIGMKHNNQFIVRDYIHGIEFI